MRRRNKVAGGRLRCIRNNKFAKVGPLFQGERHRNESAAPGSTSREVQDDADRVRNSSASPLALLKPYRRALGWGLAAVLVDAALNLCKPWPLKIVIDRVLPPVPKRLLPGEAELERQAAKNARSRSTLGTEGSGLATSVRSNASWAALGGSNGVGTWNRLLELDSRTARPGWVMKNQVSP